MHELETFAVNCGYNVSEIVADGKIHRFPLHDKDHKNSGYYVFYSNFTHSGAHQFFAGVIGSWQGESYNYTSAIKLSKSDRTEANKKIAEARKRSEELRNVEQEKVSVECTKKFEDLPVEGPCGGYLSKKGFFHLYGAKSFADITGISIFVPMRDVQGKIWSLQKIQETVAPNKLFYPSGRVKGCFHQIGELKDDQEIRICEGFATGISIHVATEEAVFVAFQSSNLLAVAQALRGKFPERGFVICGDDDFEVVKADGTPWNPGREKAEEAAQSVLGVPIFPVFRDRKSKQTDFDDLRQSEGIEAVKEQITGKKSEKYYVTALGYDSENYYFLSNTNLQIQRLSASQLGTSSGLQRLQPLVYWEQLYPGAKDQTVAWNRAAGALMQACHAVGIYSPANIRGSGVWTDNGRTVYHRGSSLSISGHDYPLQRNGLKSKFIYDLSFEMPALHPHPLTVEECSVIRDACELFRWKQSDFGYLVAGALVVARVCGALPIRPHLWVTGERGAGKSTLFEKLIYPLIGKDVLYIASNSTEAGVRQKLKGRSIPLLFDEAENKGQKSADSIQSMLDLLRVAWSETSAMVLKGSAGGTAQEFTIQCSAILASVRQIHMNDADLSRFATVELAPHGNDSEHWKQLSALLNQIDFEYGNRLFARTLGLVPVLLHNFKQMKVALNKKSPGARFADQYGMLLAGYSLLLSDEKIGEEEADILASHVPLTEAREVASVADQETCYEALLSKKISLQLPTGKNRDDVMQYERIDMTFEEAINKAIENPLAKESLQTYGIRAENGWVAIRVSHTELENLVFKGTRWSKSWAKSLIRLPGAESKTVKILGKPQKCIVLPWLST